MAIDLSTDKKDVLDNLLTLHSYALGSKEERQFHYQRIFNAEHQVYYRTAEGPVFAPVKWCGAKDNDIQKYPINKSPITQVFQRTLRRIGFKELVAGDAGYDDIYSDFLIFSRGFYFKESNVGLPHSNSRDRTFWTLEFPNLLSSTFPDEVPKDQDLIEGATKKVLVNAFERSSAARLACISHYGWSCQVCGVDFEKRYGALGREFIHVHHLRPLSELKKEYKVDPIKDLCPVCPNCHAMLHRSDPPLGIDALASLLVNS